ncbi:MAG: nucleotidyltransferase family protein [Acidiferrobacter sp.]
MRLSEILRRHRTDIRRIVTAHDATNPRIIGSVARGDDTENSDIDIMVDRMAGLTLLEQARMIEELEAVPHVHVDVVTSTGPSDLFLAQALRDAQPI